MPTVKLSPCFNDQVNDSAGNPASGWKVYTYVAGSTTPQTTYTTSAGSVAQANPIELGADGAPASPIWLIAGQTYKFILTNAALVPQRTIDNISGINDTSVSISQWVSSGVTPTYVSASSFTLVGDQTSEFHVGRRVQCTVTAGTVYGIITASAYTSLSTITVLMDGASVLDSGLSAVNLSLLRADYSAIPLMTTDLLLQAGKTIVFEGTTADAHETTLSAGEPTADRTITLPDRTGTAALTDASPVGAVIHSISSTAPTGWIKANGSTIGSATSGGTALASADSEALFTVIWASTSNTDFAIQTSAGAGTTRGASAAADFAANKRMPLPDLRGEFIRGLDDSRGVDTARAMGSAQADELESHTHGISAGAMGPTTASQGFFAGAGVSADSAATGGAETRPRNIALMAYIRYL